MRMSRIETLIDSASMSYRTYYQSMEDINHCGNLSRRAAMPDARCAPCLEYYLAICEGSVVYFLVRSSRGCFVLWCTEYVQCNPYFVLRMCSPYSVLRSTTLIPCLRAKAEFAQVGSAMVRSAAKADHLAAIATRTALRSPKRVCATSAPNDPRNPILFLIRDHSVWKATVVIASAR